MNSDTINKLLTDMIKLREEVIKDTEDLKFVNNYKADDYPPIYYKNLGIISILDYYIEIIRGEVDVQKK